MANEFQNVQNYVPAMKYAGIELYSSAGVPTASGPKTGALCVDTTNGALYINTGTAASATWNNIQAISAGEIALTTGSILIGASSVGAALDVKTSGQILVGNGTTATSVAVSGDATLASTGALTVVGATAAFNVGTNQTWTKEVNHTNSVSDTTTANTIGGGLSYTAGKGTGTAAGGAVAVTGGASSNGTGVNPGAGGAANLVAGAAGTATTGTGGAGGAANVTASAGGASTGASSTAGKGGDATESAGNGGASSGGGDTGGAGGSVVRTAGNGGTGATPGKGGAIFDRAPLGANYLRKMAAPIAKTTNATLSEAEVLNGWITVDGAGSATSTQTLPSGTALAAALPSNLATGDCFDFTVVNISTDAAENAIIAFGADITGVGSMIVEPNDSGSTYSAGTFRFRYSGSNVWIVYRIG